MFTINASQKKAAFILSIVMALSGFFFSCQKELSAVGNGVATLPPDLGTKINSNVSGFVTDEADKVVKGAVVTAGGKTILSDKFGYFEIRNVSVVKEAAVVNVGMPGYFKAVKTWIAVENKSAFFRIKLIPKNTAGTIDAVAGGTVTLGNGLTINIPANAVVNAATNAAYTGQVNVAAYWISPTATDLYRIMPGDLRGIDSMSGLKLLTTYGMAAVELTGAGGELLQMVSGKKSTLTFPIPSGISAAAPANILLWYFDETIGLWKQQGNAVKSGNNYVGDVSHFSYWNCDILLDQSVQFNFTVVDGNGKPIPNVNISIIYANGNYTGAHGFTDSTGFINGTIPANSQLVMKIYTDHSCNGPAYTQPITTNTADLSLGNITVGPTNLATVSGNVKDCNNVLVSNGFVILQIGIFNYRTVISNDGTFNINTLFCNGSISSINIVAVDNVSQQQSNTVTRLLLSGDNAMGTLIACGVSAEEFLNYTLNGTNYSFTAPVDSFEQEVTLDSSQAGQESIWIAGGNFTTGNGLGFDFLKNNIAQGSSQALTYITFNIGEEVNIVQPANVTITEYGNIGEFIAGNFTANVKGVNLPYNPYSITCNFRVRRRQ